MDTISAVVYFLVTLLVFCCGAITWILIEKRANRAILSKEVPADIVETIKAISKLGIDPGKVVDDIELMQKLNNVKSWDDVRAFLKDYRELAEVLSGWGKYTPKDSDYLSATLYNSCTIKQEGNTP